MPPEVRMPFVTTSFRLAIPGVSARRRRWPPAVGRRPVPVDRGSARVTGRSATLSDGVTQGLPLLVVFFAC